MYPHFKYLLHNIVEDEYAENNLTAQDEEIPVGDVANQSDRSDLVRRDRTTGCWEFNQ